MAGGRQSRGVRSLPINDAPLIDEEMASHVRPPPVTEHNVSQHSRQRGSSEGSEGEHHEADSLPQGDYNRQAFEQFLEAQRDELFQRFLKEQSTAVGAARNVSADRVPNNKFEEGLVYQKELDTIVGSRTDKSPFSMALRGYHHPINFKLPTNVGMYDGTKDPRNFLHTYSSAMDFRGATPELMCKAFPQFLTGVAVTWFQSLHPQSISSWDQLMDSFLGRFYRNKKFQKTIAHLNNVIQEENESVALYHERMSQEAMDIPGLPYSVFFSAFLGGLLPGPFYMKIISKMPDNDRELQRCVEKYVRKEEANNSKIAIRGKRMAEDTTKGSSKKEKVTFNQSRSREGNTTGFTPLTVMPTEVWTTNKSLFKPANPMKAPPDKRSRDRVCAFHNDHGHYTDDCYDLKRQIEDLLRQGKLAQYRRVGKLDSTEKLDTTGAKTKKMAAVIEEDESTFDIPETVVMSIHGSTQLLSNHHWKSKARYIPSQEPADKRFRHSESITFDDADAVPNAFPHNDPLVITARIGNATVHRVFVDDGSAVEVLFAECFDKLGLRRSDLSVSNAGLVGFTGKTEQPLGNIRLPVTIGEGDKSCTVICDFVVIEGRSPFNVIIGRPWMNVAKAIWSPYHLVMKFPTPNGVASIRGNQQTARQCMAIALRPLGGFVRRQQTSMVNTIMASEVVEEAQDSSLGDDVEDFLIDPTDSSKVVRVGKRLPKNDKEQICRVLLSFIDVFAWSPLDMGGVHQDVATHQLHVSPNVKPIRQKQRVFAADRQKAIEAEVASLLKAGILREVTYPTWVSNPVMVKKQDGSWRMCVDYTGLNKHCPKDCYPLPKIDQMVDSLAGHTVFAFLDAYKGYHQILMDHEDAEKTAFITSFGTFCYVKMPFGLRNAGATYQRTMDRAFAHQIGRNVEVYVDDMVIKSRTLSSFIVDLEETLSTLRQLGMKLNPKKCTFGVGTGKFLGVMVSSAGVQANPDKVQAIRQLAPPRSIKEVQILMGSLAAISRFLSRAADKHFPFFDTLKGSKKFTWTNKCDEAFSQLKDELERLPLLVVPKQGEALFLYLAASRKAVSAVLVCHQQKRQLPVYYVSRILQNAEENYRQIEKLVLALVFAVRRLRAYFHNHQITVLTDQPLQQIISKPDSSGRIAKWAIELSEHNILFSPRTAIKGQVLADFIVESTPAITLEKDEKGKSKCCESAWSMFVDGATGRNGQGAGVFLVSPEGIELKHAMRYTFPLTNNEVEYEALIGGLDIARRLGLQALKIHSDSQVVVNQTLGDFLVNEPQLQQYKMMVLKKFEFFDYVDLRKIPREENKVADALSKLAATGFHSTKGNSEVIVEVVSTRSTQLRQVALVNDWSSWMHPIVMYLTQGTLPETSLAAQRLKRQALSYTIIEGVLYKKGYMAPLLKCIANEDIPKVIAEMHEGNCGMHQGARSTAKRILRAGFYWPTLFEDTNKYVRSCRSCQLNAPLSHAPASKLIPIQSAWPFEKWGIDLVGPFPRGTGNARFLIVAVDYFTKWAEVKPLAKITALAARMFVWQNIVCRFGVPRELISDNGTQFISEVFTSWCKMLGIKQKFASVAHPQANGQVEVTNRTIVQGIQKRLEGKQAGWVEELPHVLWSYLTTPRTATDATPYRLTFGHDAMIPVEISNHSPRVAAVEEADNEDEMNMDLDSLDEVRAKAALKEAYYKEKMAKAYDARSRDMRFQAGDLVLRNNQLSMAEKTGKLSPNWEGPYKVLEAYPSNSYKLMRMDGSIVPNIWNAVNLRRFFV